MISFHGKRYKKLAQEAERLGISVSEWVRRAVDEKLDRGAR